MKDEVAKARAEASGLPLYYTEWSISSNPRDSMHDVMNLLPPPSPPGS
jgi:xylan 1,4-beta-xylosidase